MTDAEKSKEELLKEIKKLRRRVRKLETLEREERQRGFEELKEEPRAEQRLMEAVLDAMEDTFFLFEPEAKKAVRWNKAMRDVSGYTDEEIAAKKAPDDWYSLDDLVRAMEAMERNITEGRATVEMELITKSGERVPFEYTSSNITNEKGEPKYILAIGRNMTEHKLVEDYLDWQLKVTGALAQLYRPLGRTDITIEEASEVILQQAKKLTGSQHGFVSTIDPETGENVCHTLAEVPREACGVEEDKYRRIVFAPDKDGSFHGLWGHALNTRQPFYTNRPVEHPASSFLPSGHIPIDRYLGVPVMLGDELLGLIALSNPSQDYTERHLEAVIRLAEFFSLAVRRRRGVNPEIDGG